MHGVAVTITDAARDRKLKSLRFSRIDSAILVSTRDGTDSAVAKAPGILMNSQAHLPSCCWKIPNDGIDRCGNGDAQHGEAQNRIIHSIENVTSPSFRGLLLPPQKRNVLVLSAPGARYSTEGPLISSIAQYLDAVNVFYIIREDLVDVARLVSASRRDGLSPEDISLTYAMGGSGCTPSTKHVSMKNYVNTVVKFRDNIGNLRPLGFGWDLRGYQHVLWDSFESLVATAYALAHRIPLEGLLRRVY